MTPPASAGLRVAADGSVVILTLDRPQKRNAFDVATMEALAAAVAKARSDPSTGALLLTGAGGAFCGGADVSEMPEDPAAARAHFLGLTQRHHGIVKALREAPFPVVTAVDGVAAGGGLSLAAAGDLRLASPRAHYHAAYLRLGVVPDGGTTWLLPRILGAARAEALLLHGAVLAAEDAARWGLAHEVGPSEGFEAWALAKAKEAATWPRFAFREAKRLLLETWERDLGAQLDAERAANAESATTGEFRERLRAFRERRGVRS